MVTFVKVAAIQMSVVGDVQTNCDKAEQLVRSAARDGANLILLQELFEMPYFCKDQNPKYFDWAHPLDNHPTIERFRNVAVELGVVLPLSIFEKANTVFYNSLVVIDADGRVVGHYRKSHIPDGPGYQEKFYFNPGDTGFLAVDTAFGRIGPAICWDQWFPEAARILVLKGAEILFYPTAIGSEPQDPSLDSCAHWRRVMQGHAAANVVPVVAANRIGPEIGHDARITFYGSSFITNATGEIITQANRHDETILTATFDLTAIAEQRRAWGLFRDRRPTLYTPLLTLDGKHPAD